MESYAADLAHECSFTLGILQIEPALRIARDANGQIVRIEPRVMQVLVALSRAEGEILSRSDLRDQCWQGRLTSDDAVDRVIAQIRRLGEGLALGSFTVETVPKVGYRLLVDAGANSVASRDGPSHSRRSVLAGTMIAGAMLAGASAWYLPVFKRSEGTRSLPIMFAVLPFTTETPSPALDDFARELSDEIRSDISRVREIRVIAQTSSRNVAERGGTVASMAKSLGADFVVEGQVSSENGLIFANVAMIDAADGSQVWTDSESAPSNDPTVLRSALRGALVQHLAGLIPLQGSYADAVRRPDPQAYALVQQANRLLERTRTMSMRGRRDEALELGSQAEGLANKALMIDGNYAGALAVLATVIRNGWTPALARQDQTTEQRVQASLSVIRRALLAEPDNPAALTQLGDYYRRFALRWTEAENLFLRALAVDPSFVDAHWSYAYELGTTGRCIEGLDHALTVFELDPENPFRRVALPRLLYIVGRRAEAMRRYDVELGATPDNLFLLEELYFLFLSEGNASDMARLGARMDSMWKDLKQTEPASLLRRRIDAGRLALDGNPTPLRAMINAEVEEFNASGAVADATPQGRARDDLPYIFAIEYAWAGLPAQSLDMLDRALSAKSLYWPPTLPFGSAPFPRPVRDNPRFNALFERDPGVREMVRRRRSAILSRQMAGFTPAGNAVVPVLPLALKKRVRAALRDASRGLAQRRG